MKNAKKIVALLLCAVLLVGASVMGTLAYMTSQDEVVNTFTVGKVEIKLDEAPVDENGKEITGNRVHANEYHLLPGVEYDKDPMVTVIKNSERCYVRMFVTINNSADLDAIFAEKQLNLGDIFNLQNGWTLKHVTPNLAVADTRTYEFWYDTAVEKNATQDSPLAPLFTTITMPGTVDNDDLASLADDPDTEADESFKIWVVAQAIQTAGFKSNENTDADAMVEAFAAAPKIEGENLIPSV